MSVLVFALLFFQQSLNGISTEQEPTYLVRNYSVENGFPINSVNDIVQDNDGFIYFSTLDGLVRYDGYEFVTFNSSNSEGLLNNRFAGMLKAEDGALWLLEESGNVVRYKNDRFKTYSRLEGVNDPVVNIKELDGEVWISTFNGIAWFNPETDSFVQVDDLLVETGTGALNLSDEYGVLVVSEYGLVQWKEGRSKVVLDKSEFIFPTHLTYWVTTLHNGDVWVMGDMGVFCLKDLKIQPDCTFRLERPGFNFWNMIQSAENTLVFTSSLGFYEFNPESGEFNLLPFLVNEPDFRPNTLLKNSSGEIILVGDNEVIVNKKEIFRVEELQVGFVDNEGSIWLSTKDQGIFQLRKSALTNITERSGYVIENVYSIIQDQEGSIWTSSIGRGVTRFSHDGSVEQTNEGISTFGSPTSSFARHVYEDGDGTIYASFFGGNLWQFKNHEWTRVTGFDLLTPDVNETVEAMYRDEKGRLLMGTRDEMMELKPNGDALLFRDSNGKPLPGVRGIFQSTNGTLFFATNGNGLIIMDANNQTHSFTTRDGMASDYIRDLFFQSEDTLWIAAENNGLNRVVLGENHNPEEIVHISVADGLISNSLHRIIDDKLGFYWFNSNHGIMRISKKVLNDYSDGRSAQLPVIGFNHRDGMLNPEGNGGVQSAGILTKEGLLWFPTIKGITVIDPRNPGLNETLPTTQPVVEWVSFSGDQELIFGRQSLTLPKGERNISIKFTLPNFAYPERILFQYKMEDITPEWQESNESHEAVFTNMTPGTHLFEVAAHQVDGTVSIASIPITVPPYFAETSWFYLLMSLGLVGMIYIAYKYRVRSLHQRQEKLQQLVDEQTAELRKAEEAKTRFFTGITHELKTPLSMILGPVEELLTPSKKIETAQTNHYLEAIQRNGYRLKNLVDQILGVSRLNADAIRLNLHPVDIEKLTLSIIGQFHSMLQQKEIELEVNSRTISDYVYADTDAWERVVINLVSNAIKFSPQKSRIIVHLFEKDGQAILKIRDFGKGISQKDKPKIFDYLYQAENEQHVEGTGIGLFLVRGLVERMGGTVSVESYPGKGAEFIVTMRVGKWEFNALDSVTDEPLELEEAQEPPLPEPVVRASVPETDILLNLDKEHILVVEDNDDFRDYLESVLSDKYSVHTSTDGNDALSVIDTIIPDLVISDVMMPGMNGLEFVKTIREKEQFQHLPVIFLSAKDQDPDIEAGLSTGADIYLTKPIRSNMLLSQIAAVLRRERLLKESSGNSVFSSKPPTLTEQVKELVFRQLANPNLNIEAIADALFMSRSKLFKDWKRTNKVSLNEFIRNLRMEEAKQLITRQQFTIHQAARAVGFNDPNYFSTSFKKTFGVPPSEIN